MGGRSENDIGREQTFVLQTTRGRSAGVLQRSHGGEHHWMGEGVHVAIAA